MAPFRCAGICKDIFYCKFPAKCNSERISKICQHLVKVWTRVWCLVFWLTVCIMTIIACNENVVNKWGCCRSQSTANTASLLSNKLRPNNSQKFTFQQPSVTWITPERQMVWLNEYKMNATKHFLLIILTTSTDAFTLLDTVGCVTIK